MAQISGWCLKKLNPKSKFYAEEQKVHSACRTWFSGPCDCTCHEDEVEVEETPETASEVLNDPRQDKRRKLVAPVDI